MKANKVTILRILWKLGIITEDEMIDSCFTGYFNDE